jgi:hypothetical protein
MYARDQLVTTIMTLFIWAFAGALFGALFTGLYQVLGQIGFTGWQPLVIGAAAAAMTTSAFYSAMPVALLGAMAGVMGSIGYLMVQGQDVDLITIAITAGVGGVLAGLFYVWVVSGGGRPLAETLAGLTAGVVAGGLLALVLTISSAQLGPSVMAAGVVSLVGTVFQLSERWLVPGSARLFPGILSVPVVSGLIGTVVGACVWILGGTTSFMLTHQAQAAADQVTAVIPFGILGGSLGGAITGLVLQTFGLGPRQTV